MTNKVPSNSDPRLLLGTQRLTGIEYVLSQLPATSTQYPVTYLFGIMVNSQRFLTTLFSRFRSNDLVKSTGARLESVSLVVPGMNRGITHTLKIHVLNIGAATRINRMLLSMNFEELSIFPTFSDGLTVIQCVLRPKEVLDR